MGDGKDRSRVERIVNGATFNINEVKSVVDSIANGGDGGDGGDSGGGDDGKGGDIVKVGSVSFTVDEDSKLGDYYDQIAKGIGEKVNMEDLGKLKLHMSLKINGTPIVESNGGAA